MLIYNKKLSVSPVTTSTYKISFKKISKKLILEKIFLIQNFFKIILKKNLKLELLD